MATPPIPPAAPSPAPVPPAPAPAAAKPVAAKPERTAPNVPAPQATAGPKPERADLEAVANLKAAHSAIKSELAKVIVGQVDVIDELLIAIFTRSHALLMGVPGLAKTLLIQSLSQSLNMSFKRIQFTPDLMPSDITGTEVI